MRFKSAAILTFCVVVFAASIAMADNWRAPIYEYGAPKHVVGVDKKNRTFKFFEKKSPLRLRYSYPCVTGQLAGDKYQINDLRTPEGIYFVEYKIASGLDFREYGGIAYTLNYPNPVDRLRGKTGHGIWIHSKGFELVPTRGCVAINLDDIAEVGPLLLPGTPVVLAEELKPAASQDNGVLSRLRDKMSDWSAAWAARSSRMFEFYDPEAYSRATENFDLFRQNKERLFKILSFIKIYNREIHAIEGPGYWVTWSEQFYSASNLSTEGVRRLYWQADGKGDFRIVGMEWTPRDVGMAAAVRKGTLVAEASSPVATDATSEAPALPRLDMPEQAPEKAETQKGSSLALADSFAIALDPLVPGRRQENRRPDEILWGSGKRLNDPLTQRTEDRPKADPAEKKQAEIEPEPAKTAPPVPQRATPALQLPAAPAHVAEKHENAERIKEEVARLAQNWQQDLQNRSGAIDSYYDSKDYNRLPGSLGVPKGQSLATILKNIRRDFRQPWIIATGRQPSVDIFGKIARSQTDLLIATPQGLRQGVQSLWWRKDASGKYRIVGSEFRPAPLGLEANYLELVSDDIAGAIEDWRKAWEAGNIEDYMTFYAANANQQGKIGAAAIRRQKEALWGRVKPAHVILSGLRVALDGSGARADMNQSYSDSSGRGDKGVKTLLLRYDGKNWLIQREDWASQPSQTRSAAQL